MNWANKITFGRIVAVPFIMLLLIKFRSTTGLEAQEFRCWAAVFFILAMVSDAADGIIARRFNLKTQIGSMLDPLADKFLLTSSIIILCLPFENVRMLPYWFLVAAVSRDLLLVLGFVLIYMVRGPHQPAPTWLGKTTTALQMAAVLWILLGLPHPELVWRAAGFATIASGLQYVYRGSRALTVDA